MERVCNALLKELPANLPTHPPTHANSLHTATAVPHIPRQSKPAQAGLAPTHYLFSRSLRPLPRLGRGLAACASALVAHVRRRQRGRGRGALWRRGGRHLHVVWHGVRVRLGLGFGLGIGVGFGVGWLRLTARPGYNCTADPSVSPHTDFGRLEHPAFPLSYLPLAFPQRKPWQLWWGKPNPLPHQSYGFYFRRGANLQSLNV